MSDPLDYQPRQTVSQVWVFQLAVDPADLGVWTPPDQHAQNGAVRDWRLPGALGLDHLDPEKVEVFRAESLADYGLARYLTEANGLADTSVAPRATALDALSGPVVLVFSSALGNEPVTLKPVQPLHFFGRFESRPDTVRRPALASEGARGQLAPKPDTSPPPTRIPLWPLALFAALATGLIAVLLIPKL